MQQERLGKPTCRRTTRTNFKLKVWLSRFAGWGYYEESICTDLFCTENLHGFLHRFSARFFAQIFSTDFLHYYFARIFCTHFSRFFCTDSLRGFLCGFVQDVFVKTFARILCMDLLGIPNHLKKKSPKHFTMLWGPSGRGLEVSNELMGSFGKGSLQKIFRKCPRNFHKLSAPFPGAIKRISLQISAEFPQTFRKNPFANDPISELLRKAGG